MEIPYEKTMVEIFRWRVNKSGNNVAHKFEEKETNTSLYLKITE